MVASVGLNERIQQRIHGIENEISIAFSEINQRVMSIVNPIITQVGNAFEVMANIKANQTCLYYLGKCYGYVVEFYEAFKGRVAPLPNLAHHFSNATTLIDTLLVVNAFYGLCNPEEGVLSIPGRFRDGIFLVSGLLSIVLFLESIGVASAAAAVALLGRTSVVITVATALALAAFLIKTVMVLMKVYQEHQQREAQDGNNELQSWVEDLASVEFASNLSNALRLGLMTFGITSGIPFLILALTASGLGLVNAYQNRNN